MDNITHSLIGVALARQASPHGGDSRWRRAAVWSAVLASNFPDFDFILPPLLGGGKLGYLLHHRGITHTLLMTVPAALICAAIGEKIARLGWRRGGFRLVLLAWVSVVFHIVADSWNDYGVHPFWPWLNRWFYGDFIFILEPLLWLSFLPMAFQTAESRWGKALSAVLAVGLFILCLGIPLVTWPVKIAVIAFGILVALIQWKTRGRTPAIWPAFAAAILVLAAFGWGSYQARLDVGAKFQSEFPRERLEQLALSPAPGNPFCWRVIVAGVDASSGEYRARIGVHSLWDALTPAASCYVKADVARTAPLLAPGFAVAPGYYWVGEYHGRLSDFDLSIDRSCQIESFRRFSRLPFWTSIGKTADGESTWILGDLRYDREVGLGFAEIEFQPTQPNCSRWIPKWEPPMKFE